MKKQLITLEVLKVDKKIGLRPVGSKFSAEKVDADVWTGLGLAKDVNAKPLKKKEPTKKVAKK